MKLTLLSIFLALPLLTGCPSATAPTPPLAPGSGYSGTPDQQMGATLRGADGYYKTIQCETQGMNWKLNVGCVTDPNITTPLVLSATEKTAMADLMIALNVANVAYTAYHSGTGTEAAAQTAINTASAKQTAAQALIPGEIMNWKSLIPLLEMAGNTAELLIPGGAAFVPLTTALENAVNPALLAVGNGNSATNEILAGYGALIGVLTALKANTKLAPADLANVESQLIAVGNALSEYMAGLTGYDASAYTPLTPIV